MKTFVFLLLVKLLVLWPVGQQPDSCATSKQQRQSPPKAKAQAKQGKASSDRNWLLYRIPLSI